MTMTISPICLTFLPRICTPPLLTSIFGWLSDRKQALHPPTRNHQHVHSGQVCLRRQHTAAQLQIASLVLARSFQPSSLVLPASSRHCCSSFSPPRSLRPLLDASFLALCRSVPH